MRYDHVCKDILSPNVYVRRTQIRYTYYAIEAICLHAHSRNLPLAGNFT